MTRSHFADLIAEIRRISKLPNQSAATIAKELNVTRNCVIGLAHRNSIPMPGRSGRKPGQFKAIPSAPVPKGQPSKPRAIGPRTVHRGVTLPTVSNPPATPAAASETETGGLSSLLNLDSMESEYLKTLPTTRMMGMGYGEVPAQYTQAWTAPATGTLGSMPHDSDVAVWRQLNGLPVEDDLAAPDDDTPEPPEDEPEPLNLPGLPITALKGAQCRWPVYPVDTDAAWAAGPHRFCAAPTGDATTPYCRHHAPKAVGRGTKSERAAESTLKWGARQ